MNNTPIYNETYSDALDSIIEAGTDEQALDALEHMDKVTKPKEEAA